MNAIGLRELRQNASEVIRRVEAREEITVTVVAPIRKRDLPEQGGNGS